MAAGATGQSVSGSHEFRLLCVSWVGPGIPSYRTNTLLLLGGVGMINSR